MWSFPPHDLDPTKQQKTLKSISLFRSPPFLSRWRPRRWRCCPSGAEKTAGLCWRNKSESSDSGFPLRRCRCSTMWWRTGGASFLQWEMWALWWNNPDLIPDSTHTWLFGGSCAHLPLGGTVCSCSALCSVCRKESTGASWHPWQSCRHKDRFYTFLWFWRKSETVAIRHWADNPICRLAPSRGPSLMELWCCASIWSPGISQYDWMMRANQYLQHHSYLKWV